MNLKPIHTIVVDSRTIDDITIIREDPENYPKGKSNIYAKNFQGDIIWYAELPITGDIYCNPIQWNQTINENADSWNDLYESDAHSFAVCSWLCFTVAINIRSGKIIRKVFTK
jgi:hypothetical protein